MVRAGSEPKSQVSISFTGDAPYSDEEQLRLNAVVEVLNIRIIDILREKLTLIYGGSMRAAWCVHRTRTTT
ncbi:insulinase family protein [Rhodoferax sp. AJA081-3]|uniref:insulinase family protein n=1 Tax=Rhodoferax sp. AJA081-3 TaxID=2752316 RepID=UPI001FD741F8|nr:insulinase family protein [Rhodoferax sp. AJA081-3]